MTRVTWIKCQGDVWCSLRRLNLKTVKEHGVYVIWHGGQAPHVVYVGQGDVAARLADHRENPDILSHDRKGELFVTWAAVSVAERDGIERYLADKYSPLEGESHPDVASIAVNSPWD
jgi:hypothetical protein